MAAARRLSQAPEPLNLGDARLQHNRHRAWRAGRQRNLALEGYCQSDGCGNFFVFNVDHLIASTGADYLVPEILPGITCSVCGGALKVKLAMMRADDEEGAGSDV